MTPEDPFACLVGEQLNTVAFVMDYVEFHFNGPRIRSLTNPLVRSSAGIQSRFPASGSRDALCGLIGDTVSGVSFKEGDSLTLRFGSGSQLVVPLDADSYRGPEGMHWHPDADLAHMYIW